MQYLLFIKIFLLLGKTFPSPFSHIFIQKFVAKHVSITTCIYIPPCSGMNILRDDEKFPSIKSEREREREKERKIERKLHFIILRFFFHSIAGTSSMCLIKIVNPWRSLCEKVVISSALDGFILSLPWVKNLLLCFQQRSAENSKI